MTTDDDFTDFAATRWRRLVHAAMLLGCDLHEAEDLVQSTLMKAYVSWSRVARADRRDAYVSRMLLNGFRAARRRRWRGEQPTAALPEHPSGATDLVDGLADRDAVSRALGALTDEQREVVVLRHVVELTEAETAHVLGVPAGTVKSRLSRALAALADDPHLADFDGRSRS